MVPFLAPGDSITPGARPVGASDSSAAEDAEPGFPSPDTVKPAVVPLGGAGQNRFPNWGAPPQIEPAGDNPWFGL